jgi:ubiquinone/menaquinone biosynthesis C-methylase UbiE
MITAGDYTGLAADYSRYRPGYSESVMERLFDLLGMPRASVRFVDVGAGTGIWTRMVCRAGVASAVAVEPNDDMRATGIADSLGLPIRWLNTRAESTGLADGCCDWLTMASAFHWTDFHLATREFHRVLRRGGLFTALWNPRAIERNPLLTEIEAQLYVLRPELTRQSSGRSAFTAALADRLHESPHFEDVRYFEDEQRMVMSPEQYIGAWRSVNDVQAQLGAERFEAFLRFVEQRVRGINGIEVTYLTRAWSARTV